MHIDEFVNVLRCQGIPREIPRAARRLAPYGGVAWANINFKMCDPGPI
jgi:hypothetical protein